MYNQQDSSAILLPEKTEKSASSPKSRIKSPLRTKATLLAISIGIIPMISVGLFAREINQRSLTKEVYAEQLEEAELGAITLSNFLEDRVREVELLADNPFYTEEKYRNSTSAAEKASLLNVFAKDIGYFNSILVFDPQGNIQFQADIEPPYTKNYGGKAYFQEAVKTKQTTINGPGLNSSGQLRVEFAVPILDKTTGEVTSVIRAKIPGNYLNRLFKTFEAYKQHWNLINEEGLIFAGDRTETLAQPLEAYSDRAMQLHRESKSGGFKSKFQLENQADSDSAPTQVASYVTAPPPSRFPDLKIGTIISRDEDLVYATVRRLEWTLLVGTLATGILVSAIATYLANRGVKPILEAGEAVKKIGRGELDTRLQISSEDELGELGSNINLMTEQIQNSLQEQQALAEEQRQGKERLELAIGDLLNEVSDAVEGDLTVRANLDSMELSTVADLFNAIIDNLQEIAIEAKQSSGQVGESLRQNEAEIRLLAEQATAEAKETRDTLLSVELMSQSIQAVAENASQVEKISNDTYNTIVSSTDNMDLTVTSILELRSTVGETSKKMKRLGESSQKISQAVSLIEEIALKTNVLAINASVEAGRAGEYGQGFTIVAEQVGALAEQSAAATKEIAGIVAAIQAETQEVNQAMESGTTQVIETSRTIESTKQGLSVVLEKSREIDRLMKSISQNTVSQADTSHNVTSLMQKIARLSESTSESSAKVAQSIVETAQVAAKLESAVGQFKVAE